MSSLVGNETSTSTSSGMASSQPQQGRIVVLGAGVLGLTTALKLALEGHRSVTVVAKHMPSDHHPEYTSIWAGVNWVPVSAEGSEAASWDIESWNELKKLADTTPAAGVWLQDKTTYYRNEDRTLDTLHLWFKDLVPDFKILGRDKVPDFADWGTFYRTIALDPSIYLHFLQSRCLSLGVSFRRATVDHVLDAFFFPGPAENATAALDTGTGARAEATADIVVNCTGLLASRLGGVEDASVRPVRGQLVIVENESRGMFSLSGDAAMDEEVGENCYIIGRPAGGGTALGGSYYETWDHEPDMALAERIMQRSVRVCPGLVPPGAGAEKLRVIRHQAGLRPVRAGGPRIETQEFQNPDHGALQVVHCYGAGGFGFQSSYGMAGKAVRLVRDGLVAKSGTGTPKSLL